jgi:hypothetical protein
MNIIKHGKFYHEATCPMCCCVFGYIDGYMKTDVKTRYKDLEVTAKYISCPECGHTVDVSPSK